MSCLTKHCGSFQHGICCPVFTVLLGSSQSSQTLALVCVFLMINPVVHDHSFRCPKELYHSRTPLPQQHCSFIKRKREQRQRSRRGTRTCAAEPPSWSAAPWFGNKYSWASAGAERCAGSGGETGTSPSASDCNSWLPSLGVQATGKITQTNMV